MKTLLTSVTLGIFLPAPVMTYPVASAKAPAMNFAHPHHKAKFAHARALAPLWVVPPGAAPSSTRETDGLSRNPDDCTHGGCIDNGGG
jgi:hypothetical protein